MMQYSLIEVKNGNLILESTSKRFQEVFEMIKHEIELFNSKVSTEIKLDIHENKIRIGLDVITAEDLLVLNQKIAEEMD